METPAKQIHHQYTAEERTQWVSRFRSSGLTQVQFGQENGLKQKTLQRWLYGRKSWRVLKRRLASLSQVARFSGEIDGLAGCNC
jgi:hypothetical protein